MKKLGGSMLNLVVVLGVGVLILIALLLARGLPSGSHARATQAVINRFTGALAQYRERHGHLPGDANRDGEIDAREVAQVAPELARAGLIRSASAISADIAGRSVTLRVIARAASALPNPPRGRNVIELWGLPCQVARDFDATTDDGNFAKGNVRASVIACRVGGENDPAPIVAVSLPR